MRNLTYWSTKHGPTEPVIKIAVTVNALKASVQLARLSKQTRFPLFAQVCRIGHFAFNIVRLPLQRFLLLAISKTTYKLHVYSACCSYLYQLP